MAKKATAIVSVGADTSPFRKAMGKLGGTKIGGRKGIGGGAMSGLGLGIGGLAAFAGIKGLSGIFDNMKAASPEFAGAMESLSRSMTNSLLPAAEAVAIALNDAMPAITEGLGAFGDAVADAIQFWTEDVLDLAVWQDIGDAIVDGVKDSLGFGGGVTLQDQARGGAVAVGGDAWMGDAALGYLQTIAERTAMMSPAYLAYDSYQKLFGSDESEGAGSL